MKVSEVAQAGVAVVEPVVKEILVPLPESTAFDLFTVRASTWWPLVTHSVAGEEAVACTFEPRVGGRLYETARDGTEHTWGTLLCWEPPSRIALTWHPGRAPSTEQHLEVTFSAAGGGSTLVRLVHTGWERLGKTAAVQRENYGRGWDVVLGHFVEAAR